MFGCFHAFPCARLNFRFLLQQLAPLNEPGKVTQRTVLNVFGPMGQGGRYILDSLKVMCQHLLIKFLLLINLLNDCHGGSIASISINRMKQS